MTKFLDSNILIDVLKGKTKLKKSENYFISPIVYAEVLYGLLYIDKKASQFDNFLEKNQIEIVQVGRKTAETYTKIKLVLNKKGMPLEDNDLLITASCLEYGLPLVTENLKHFMRIKKLKILKSI